jgi:hypothetical protein
LTGECGHALILSCVTCDASGSFSFPRVPDGVWYVTTAVKWDGPGDRAEGGSMMKRVDVRGGKLVKATLP